MRKWIIEAKDPQLNASLLITLIPPAILRDYEFQEDGLHCYFRRSIYQFQAMIKTFLDALFEITNKQFYFEIINDQEAILKIYGIESLQFSRDVLLEQSVSS